MKRREAIQHIAVGAAGAGGLWAAACGDDDGGGGGGTDAGACNTMVEIMDNHGHVLRVPDRDVRSGTGATYTTTGGDHTHTITITMIAFRDLQRDGAIMAGTEGGADHEHPIRITCA